ncbi:hypothetical protein BV22DRAFT_1053278 [Leucogyrophana mollusca]|uniref:Uncharacterized protein n=1 Tax=Leucogyrophana mollusca TaxID=85980 RepID=A0ACB8C0I5_9AGAM|nr:hypothetical protein BV22DRAFT_1053278 [Leucogyrophana mollusca]
MLAGSTSGLRLSSAQLPCRLRQAQLLFAFPQKQGETVLQGRRRSHAAHCMKDRVHVEESSVNASITKEDFVNSKTIPRNSARRFTRPTRSVRPVYGQLGVSQIRDHLSPTLDVGIAQSATHPDVQNLQQTQRGSIITSPSSMELVVSDNLTEMLNRRKELLRILAKTSSLTDAWSAYNALLSMRPNGVHVSETPTIPYSHLHRLARLLASTKPRTRTLFLQLSSVLTTLQNSGGSVQLWEWNALMDSAGKRWRRTGLEDFKAALDIFSSITTTPAVRSSDNNEILDDHFATHPISREPDIVTYTTLLYIAGRSMHPAAIRHATSLLRTSGLPPNRITHLSLLGYFTRTNQLSGVRSTLLKMKEQNLRVGLDGINACIWAYARNGHMDVAATIYRVLRNNLTPEVEIGEHDIDAAIEYLSNVEGVVVGSNLIPDEVTYTAMIQSLAYHGDLIRSLQVFVDMLSTPNIEPFAPVDDATGEPLRYQPTLAAFRGVFLGFVRHGHKPRKHPSRPILLSDRLHENSDPSHESPWNLNNLHALFKTFMDMPGEVRPSERLIYWILMAFGKASGDDSGKLRKVWSQLEQKFGGGWGGRLERMRKSIHAEGGGSKH